MDSSGSGPQPDLATQRLELELSRDPPSSAENDRKFKRGLSSLCTKSWPWALIAFPIFIAILLIGRPAYIFKSTSSGRQLKDLRWEVIIPLAILGSLFVWLLPNLIRRVNSKS